MSDARISRIVIDRAACVGVGACELLASDLVKVGDDGVAVAADLTVSWATAAALRDARPSGALDLVTGEG